MTYRKLGRTGLSVSTQCLGAMMFGATPGDRQHSRENTAREHHDLGALTA